HTTAATFSSYIGLRDLHSFPTRRSSDLELRRVQFIDCTLHDVDAYDLDAEDVGFAASDLERVNIDRWRTRRVDLRWTRQRSEARSEEHTSELQSLRHLVCRLLREKKKHI